HASSVPAPHVTPGSPSTTTETTKDHDEVLLGYSRPMDRPLRLFGVVAGLPVTVAKGSDVVGAEVRCTRYDSPVWAARLNVPLVWVVSTVVPALSRTSTLWLGHGFRTVMVPVAPAVTATVV